MQTRKTKKLLTYFLILTLLLTLCQGMIPGSVAEAAVSLRNPRRNADDVVTWDCVYFGNYWQSDTNGDGTADKKDKKQPIKWRVLSVEGDDAFLVADSNLDCQRYNDTYTDVTWEICTMRSWLNGYGASANVCERDYTADNFMDNAFTSGEQAAVTTTDVVNEDNPEYGTEGGNTTQDKVYLLSIGDVTNPAYGFSSDPDSLDDTREALDTKYVADEGIELGYTNTANLWLLRSPGLHSRSASYVYSLGWVIRGGIGVDGRDGAVRPALHLNLSSTSNWSYAGTVSAEGETDEQATSAPEESPEPTVTPQKPEAPSTGLPGVTPGVANSGEKQQAGNTETGNPVSSLGKPVIKSVKNKKGRKIKIKLKKKVKGAAGYQIQYARNKKFTKAKKSKDVGAWTSAKTIAGLKKGKTYYVRVRAYQNQSGKKVYGKWSKAKKVKVKR